MLRMKTINTIFWAFFAIVFVLFLSTFARADDWKWHENRSYIPLGDEKIFTADKEAHFFGGVVLMKIGTDLCQSFGLDYHWSLVGTFAAGFLAGVTKEWVYDAYRDGFSFGDIMAQISGQGISGVLWTKEKEKAEVESTIDLTLKKNGVELVVRF